MKNLQEVIENRKPIKIYLDDDYYDTFYYNEDKNIYQGNFGYITMEVLMKAVFKKKGYEFLKIEGE